MIKTRFSRWLTFFTFAAAVALALPAKANTWPLPPAGSRLVGENKFHVVENDGGSLEAIAKKYNVGFLALLQANPGVDPYVPRAGSVLTIPLQTLLPDAPREGIVINIAELRLYYYPPGKNSVTVYPIGIGQLGGDTLTPTMVTTVSDKRANPTWTPTANIRARYKAQGIELPAVVPAGPDNPMGHHAIRLAAYGGVINIAELRLYYYPPGKNSVTVYPIGIGQLGGDTLTPTMVTTVSDKRANPTWTPTANIRARYKAQGIELPAVVPAGPDNPMGHHAIRLAAYGGVYLLHGTNADFGIGMRVSSGCIRLRDDDIKTLFSQVTPGTKVNIINTPIKVSAEPNGARLVEVHQPLSEKIDDDPQLLPITLNSAMQSFKDAAQTDAEVMQHVMDVRSGMPVDVRRHQVSPQTL
ncbi:L,D-transpeptidase family protein [Escherichia coli]|nr:L,D-transpeptidase family protein [Escherichia coli]